jgi:hypothetical protein
MRTPILFALALLAANGAVAAPTCQPEYLSAEDVAIMASVAPAAPLPADRGTRLAGAEPVKVLYSLHDYLGRLGEEDLSQIQSVQPQGAKVVSCLVPARHN